jgi:N-acetylneuraminate synthase
MYKLNFEKNKVFIIAEACDNHFGDLDNAKQLVLKAKSAGADIIKFQHHIPDEEMLKDVPRSKNFKISLYDFLKKYALKLKDHEELIKFCKKNKIQYLCTPFSYKAACELNDINVQFFKVGSGEFTDYPFIRKLCKFNKPIIFSTGMSSIKDIDFIYKKLLKIKRNQIIFMNCTSEYPPLLKDINLGFIPIMKKKYSKFIIGHSDHTNDIYTSFGAVALGAKLIEKHVYLDKKNFGPDKDVSISFEKLKRLVEGVRILEKSLGSEKRIYEKEKSIEKWAKRSLVAIRDIKKNQILTKNDIWSKRPGTGIPSRLYDKFIGKKAEKKIKSNTLLNYKHFIK